VNAPRACRTAFRFFFAISKRLYVPVTRKVFIKIIKRHLKFGNFSFFWAKPCTCSKALKTAQERKTLLTHPSMWTSWEKSPQERVDKPWTAGEKP
jgi:hypothetical protein